MFLVIQKIQGDPEIQNKCLGNCCPKNCKSSYKLGKNVVKTLKVVKELIVSGRRFANVAVTDKVSRGPVVMPVDDTVGLDLMVERVWESIENVGIIGLYGMGGCGKTTLLKRINNEFGKRQHNFDVVILHISDDIWNNTNEARRAATIYRVLRQKIFVLLLDDVWEKLELEEVGIPSSDKNQSKIQITTRIADVCAKMHARTNFKVEFLTIQEAFDLFRHHVGEETLNYHQDIPRLAEEIVLKCKGLPLALITVGSAMAGVNSIKACEDTRNQLSYSPLKGSDLENDVFSILKFSYDRLPDETHKKCFLYCALYPEDHEIYVPTLLDRWIGEGFPGNGKSIYDMYDLGESVIQRLKFSGLLESDTYPEQNHTIKMHDTIRDMALWLARDQNRSRYKVLVQGEASTASRHDVERWRDVERISLLDKNEDWHVPACPNLLTLIVGKCRSLRGISNFQSMTSLKVLDLQSNNWLVEIPTKIGRMIHLEFLNLLFTDINKLPIELKNLSKLRMLLVDVVKLKLDDEITLEVISSLERLKVFRFSRSHGSQTMDEIAFLERLQEPMGVSLLLAHMRIMEHLESIFLDALIIVEDSSMNGTYHFPKLRTVHILNCHYITHLTWLKCAPVLDFLMLVNCLALEEIINEDLEAQYIAQDDTLSRLRAVIFLELPKLRSIHRRALPFPSLRVLTIQSCPQLKKLPFDYNSAEATLKEIAGARSWWKNLEWGDPALKDIFLPKFRPIWYILKLLDALKYLCTVFLFCSICFVCDFWKGNSCSKVGSGKQGFGDWLAFSTKQGLCPMDWVFEPLNPTFSYFGSR
uniref:Putative disease resistance protein n=1 Tax=Cercis chinensis TaxID=161750 RepID=U6EFF3_9FABA|nr:putative disease resistance protein [Cercis chinensis]